MANLRKLKQSKRDLPGHVKRGEPLARTRRQHGLTPKKNALHGTKRPAGESMPRVETQKRRLPEGEARRIARIERKSKHPAAAKTGRARVTSQAEKMATARATRLSVGERSGGQTGNKRRGGVSPSRGRRGTTPKMTRR